MNKINLYIVVEGTEVIELLSKILPVSIVNRLIFIPSLTHSSALAQARTLLINSFQNHIILIINVDTINEQEVIERTIFINDYLKLVANEYRYKTFVQVPEIESIFFEDQAFITKLVGRTLSDLEFELAKQNPKKSLEILLEEDTLQNRLLNDKDILTEASKLPFFKELNQYLLDVDKRQVDVA